MFALGYQAGEAGARLVYEQGAAQVYVENGGVAGGVLDGDEGEDSDSH